MIRFSSATPTAARRRQPALRAAVTVEKDGERREVRSDHVAFHRFVEGLKEDYRL